MPRVIHSIRIYKLKNRAWTQGVKLCGGVVACSILLGVHHSTISKWLSDPTIEILYEHAIIISFRAKIPLKDLSPSTQTANENIQEMSSVKKGIPFINQQHLKQLGVKYGHDAQNSQRKTRIIYARRLI